MDRMNFNNNASSMQMKKEEEKRENTNISTAFDKDKYAKLFTEKVNEFMFGSSLMLCEPSEMTNEDIMYFIKERNIPKRDVAHPSEFDEANMFCSLINHDRPQLKTLDKPSNNPFEKQVTYKTIKFYNDRFSLGDINLSQFKWDSTPIIKQNNMSPIIVEGYKVRNTIDFNEKNIFMLSHNWQFLYLYSFPTLNSFGKKRRCYRFMSIKDDGGRFNFNGVRRAILNTQYFMMLQLINHPTLFSFPVVYYREGRPMGGSSMGDDIYIFTEEVFYRDCMAKANDKLKEIEETFRYYNLHFASEDDWVDLIA